MAKVALCSERFLGGESYRDLAACASEFSAQGHTVFVICSNLGAVCAFSEFDNLDIFQAPSFSIERPSVRRSKFRPRSVSELLISQGYGAKQAVGPVLRAWLDLLNTLEVDHVISEQSPTSLLAAKLMSVSCVMIGDGFTVPPTTAPSPTFRPWRSEPEKVARDHARAMLDDQLLVETINNTIIELGFENTIINSTSELYSHADQWLMSVPEMDHYGSRDLPYVVRWPSTKSLDDAVWPDVEGEKVFVVIDSKSSHCSALFHQLGTLKLPVLAVVADASPQFISRFSSDTIMIQTKMVSVRSVTQQCKIIFSHAEHDLVYECLTMGVPSILLPKGMQNTLLTFRLAKKRLGFAGPSKSAKLNVIKLIEKTKNVDQVWHNASRFSLKYATHTSLTRLNELIEALFSDTE